MVIPEGLKLWGWRGFSLAVDGILGNSKPPSGKDGTSGGGSKAVSSSGAVPISVEARIHPEGNGYKAAVIKGIEISEIKGHNVGNTNARNKGAIQGNDKEVNAIGDICLQFKLMLGRSGKWEVEEALVVDHKPVYVRPNQVPLERPVFKQNPTHIKSGVIRHQHKGPSKPKPIWRPVTPLAASSGLVNKPDPQDSSRLPQESTETAGTAGTHKGHG